MGDDIIHHATRVQFFRE